MSPTVWFDNRTLFACQCLLMVIFAAVFFGLSRAYPQLKGVRAVALAFMAGVPCALLLLVRGVLPGFLSITMANLLALIAYVGLYAGVVEFVGTRNRWKPLVGMSVAVIGVVGYFSAVRPMILPGIVAMGIAITVVGGMTAWILLGLADGEMQVESVLRRTWGIRLLLGSFVTLMTVTGVERTVSMLAEGAQEGLMAHGSLQRSTMVVNLVYVAVFGVCFLVMSCQVLIARSREDLEKDSLTGLPNRRGVEGRLELELKRCGRIGQRLCVAMVDVDGFKAINDALGHGEGDEALKGVVRAMLARLRDTDYLGRFGGDEFLVVLPHMGLDATPLVAERLGFEVSRLGMMVDGRRLSISIGITEAGPEDDVAGVVARADEALYAAKKAGRACWRMVAPERTFAIAEPGLRVGG